MNIRIVTRVSWKSCKPKNIRSFIYGSESQLNLIKIRIPAEVYIQLVTVYGYFKINSMIILQ